MWYFAWILGVSLAALLAVVNAMMYEVRQDNERAAKSDEPR
ncbi:MAG: cytochrome bd-I oxidase subunit CydX [Burkholderiaceae bacterium]